jgi:hypothetical protein
MHQHLQIMMPILVVAIGLSGCERQSTMSNAPVPPSPVPAVVAPSVTDLVGATIIAGATALTSRGYTAAVTHDITTYWWHSAGSCVRVVVADDHYKVVEPVTISDCGR